MYAGCRHRPGRTRPGARRAGDLVDDVLAEDGVPAAIDRRGGRPEGPAERCSPRAAGADLLVVGSRSRGTLPGMLLGSVALHCAVHAPCPVMVVRPEPKPARPRAAVAATPAAHR